MTELKRTERGWPGHFICADRCQFRRNTLLEYGDVRIVVSTVGLMTDVLGEKKYQEIGLGRYFETMAFHARFDGRYWDADVVRGELDFDASWSISETNADDRANDMHEAVIDEISERMMKGEFRESVSEKCNEWN